MRVMVYRNLNTGGYSIKDQKTNRVIARSEIVYLKDVEFRVQKGGQARARRERQRNVHAYAIGELLKSHSKSGMKRVTYDPFIHDTFVIKSTGRPVLSANYCVCDDGGCFVS